MGIKEGAQISDLVRIVSSVRRDNLSGNAGLVIDQSLDKTTGRRVLLVRWSFKKTKQNKSDMVEFWIYEEELEIISQGVD
jgi:hypothetical protein|tara:strand:+ start:64 stop:303 length:240 start_codon:yes stop_codon:yes gene_type:complete